MISYLECYPCLVRHSLEASRQITEDPDLQRKVMNRVLKLLPDLPQDASPVRMAAEVHRIIRAELNVTDPYLEQKKKYNRIALGMLPKLRRILDGAPDRIETAVRIAIAGNIIDFGAYGEDFDIEASVDEILRSPLGVNDYPRLRDDLRNANRIVYVGDNAGEIVFDRLLVEEIRRICQGKVFFVVRGAPILNDATLEDADAAGVTEIAEVASSGGDAPGCELGKSPEIRELFEKADVIISKGQGNYEALSREPYPIYFLLRVKCEVIARDLEGKKGTGVVKFNEGGST